MSRKPKKIVKRYRRCGQTLGWHCQFWLRKAKNLDNVTARRRLVDRALKLRQEIELDFNTVAHWNENVRKPDETPIDYDQDGALRRWCDALDAFIKSEAH